MKKKHLIPLAVVLWSCLGALTWAQVQVLNPTGGITFDGTNITASGPIYLQDGTAAAPSLAFASGTNQGLMKNGTGMAIALNNLQSTTFFSGGRIPLANGG